MKKGVIYYTRVREEYAGEHLDHMIAEKLLAKPTTPSTIDK